MTQANPFSGFQTDPFFDQFQGDFFSGTPFAQSDVFSDFLEEEPNLAFQGALNQQNLPFSHRQQLQQQRQDIFNKFQGLQRFDPSLRFTPFIENFNFGRERFRTPLNQRQEGTPRTSFIR